MTASALHVYDVRALGHVVCADTHISTRRHTNTAASDVAPLIFSSSSASRVPRYGSYYAESSTVRAAHAQYGCIIVVVVFDGDEVDARARARARLPLFPARGFSEPAAAVLRTQRGIDVYIYIYRCEKRGILCVMLTAGGTVVWVLSEGK